MNRFSGAPVDRLARIIAGQTSRRGLVIALGAVLFGGQEVLAAKVPLGGRCTRKLKCANGAICRDKICGCFGNRVSCGEGCFALVRGDTADGCTKVPGTTYCPSDHYCKKLPYAGDMTCTCDEQCCSSVDSPAACRNGECCILTGGACGDMDHACCSGTCGNSGHCA